MKLSTRSTYGIRALVEIALAAGREPLSAAGIARRQDLSVAYLEQLLHRLKRAEYVSSLRGPRGGYVLAREPRHITMAEIVRVLDGANGMANGKSRKPKTNGVKTSARYTAHITEAVRQGVHERIEQALDAVTLQDLCDQVRTAAGEPLDHRYVFHI